MGLGSGHVPRGTVQLASSEYLQLLTLLSCPARDSREHGLVPWCWILQPWPSPVMEQGMTHMHMVAC